LEGDYAPNTGDIDFDVDLKNLNLNLFAPFMKETLNEISGFGHLNLTLDGTLEKPEVNGEVLFDNASIQLAATKTKMTLSDKLRIYKNMNECSCI
jgi:autotransporter translocation and assembly factor TamB